MSLGGAASVPTPWFLGPPEPTTSDHTFCNMCMLNSPEHLNLGRLVGTDICVYLRGWDVAICVKKVLSPTCIPVFRCLGFPTSATIVLAECTPLCYISCKGHSTVFGGPRIHFGGVGIASLNIDSAVSQMHVAPSPSAARWCKVGCAGAGGPHSHI